MIPNSTVNDTTTTTTTVSETQFSNYDDTGAMIYIIIVLLWYSIGIIFMLGMQMRPHSETIEDSARRRTKLLIRNLRDHTNTKEILEELVDKKKRARLWDIYLGTKTDPKEKLTRAEIVRIRHIEKQLANLNRDRRLTNETLFPTESEIRYYRSRSDFRNTPRKLSPIEPSPTLRRRSSFDQQTLERWKALANQSKTTEQMPWSIRKLMIGKYFHRHPKQPLATIPQTPTIDHLLTFADHLTRHRSDSDIHESSSYDERKNPYLTYFYRETDHPNKFTSEFGPVSSEHSIE